MKHEKAINKAFKAFQDKEEDALLKLECLKEREDYRAYYAENIGKVKAADSRRRFHEEMLRRFGILPSSYAGRPFEEWASFFDPLTDARKAPAEVRRYILPYLFYWPGVREVVSLTPPDSAVTVIKGKGECPRIVESAECEPYERLYKVDLRKKPAQLLKEFKAELASVDASRGINPKAYTAWKQDRSRKREVTRRDLDIYRLWRDKETFPAIAEKLGIESAEKVKQAFYSIFQQIHGRPYDMKTDRSELRKAPLMMDGLCPTCPKLNSCERECAALKRHLRKHTKYFREDYSEETISNPTPEEAIGRKKLLPSSDKIK